MSVLEGAEVTGGFAFGEASEEGIEELRKDGMLVELAGASDDEPTPAPGRRVSALELLPTFSSMLRAQPMRAVDVFVLSLAGPLLPTWRTALEELGVELLAHYGGRRFTARVGMKRLSEINDLHFVDHLRHYSAADTVDLGHLTELHDKPIRFELILQRAEDADSCLTAVSEAGGEVIFRADRSVQVWLYRPDELAEIAGRPEVASIYRYVSPTPANDRARAMVGAELVPPIALAWTGAGQTVGVADSGVDANHPDLSHCLMQVIARGRPNDPTDTDGHGTHVAGTIGGNGSKSAGAYRGMAPDAQLVFQSIMDANGSYVGPGTTMTDLLDEAYQAGARIHNDSWGVVGNGSAYRAYDLQLDKFVHEHPDMLVVVAAGNDATSATPHNPNPGWVDTQSIASPGVAKNALTAGASQSDRAAIGRPPLTYGAWYQPKFPDPPTSIQDLSGLPSQLAAFSGRGPCEATRIKPDIVAPGTFVLSTRSSTVAAAATQPWAPGPMPEYSYEGGTSMAAPIVAGCAALVREYLTNDRGFEPSAALLKAILVNGAERLAGPDAVAAPAGEPNFHQGFGRLSLTSSVPTPADPGLGLEFSDDWQQRSLTIHDIGNGIRFEIAVDAARLIRVCLAWTDPPNRGIQNLLVLRVTHPYSGQEWRGNAGRNGGSPDKADPSNNVQIVRPDIPLDGTVEITVEADSIFEHDQTFALVVTGSLNGPLTDVDRW